MNFNKELTKQHVVWNSNAQNITFLPLVSLSKIEATLLIFHPTPHYHQRSKNLLYVSTFLYEYHGSQNIPAANHLTPNIIGPITLGFHVAQISNRNAKGKKLAKTPLTTIKESIEGCRRYHRLILQLELRQGL